jgi:hypothetical protein
MAMGRIIIIDDDSPTTRGKLITCPICNGTGKCKPCKGTGTVWDRRGPFITNNCEGCGGTGNCPRCHGDRYIRV